MCQHSIADLTALLRDILPRDVHDSFVHLVAALFQKRTMLSRQYNTDQDPNLASSQTAATQTQLAETQ
jgi:hypothetical protein